MTTALPPPPRQAGSKVSVPGTLALPAVLFLFGFFLLPLLWNLSRSFPTISDGLAAYAAMLSDPYYLRVIANTVGLSTIVTILAVVVGYPIAYFLVRKANRSSGLIVFLLIAPLLTSIIMRTYGWRVIFARRGVLNNTLIDLGLIDRPLVLLDNPLSAVIGLLHVLVPFMVLAIATSLQSVERNLEDSARILGANRLQTFFRITFPLTLDGIATGFILVFMLANGSFVTVLFLGGGSLPTLPLLIYQQFNTTRDFAFASVASNVLLVLTLVCLFLQLRFIRRRGVAR